jgi:tetratricopeptide (TPR) repeat protein
MKEDTFIATTLKAWEYLRDHEKSFFIGLVVIVCIAAMAGWAAYARKQGGVKAASHFADAMASFRTGDLKTAQEMFALISKEYGGREEGICANYFVGKCLLETGKHAEAIEAFDRYLSKSGRNPFFRDAAMEGKAVSLESEHRYKDAGDAYLELSKNLKTNRFMETTYLKRAAESFRLANETEKAIEVLGILLDKANGTERRDIEVEMEILRG